jgi:putative NADH-flavin reductase
LVFGASGRTGRWLVADAVAKGHRVTAFMRRRPKYCGGLDGARILLGDVLQPKSIEAAVVGQDAVFWCVAPRAMDASSRLISMGTTNVLWAMQRAGSRLLICASAFGVGDSRWGGPYARVLRRVLGQRVLDMERQEEAIRGSGVEWVIVRPTLLTNGPRTESYRIGTDLHLGLFPRISRANVAHFMMRQLAEPTFHQQAVAVTS